MNINNEYQKQVALLLDILPEVAEEKIFALHGGTAINLFHTKINSDFLYSWNFV